MQTPTEQELRAVDEQLAAMGCNDLTEHGMKLSDRRWRDHNDQLSVYEENCEEPDNHCPTELDQVEAMTQEELSGLMIEAGIGEEAELIIKGRRDGLTWSEIAKQANSTTDAVRWTYKQTTTRLETFLPKSRWFGLHAILRQLDTLESNWPKKKD